jgi:hypothetical protein
MRSANLPPKRHSLGHKPPTYVFGSSWHHSTTSGEQLSSLCVDGTIRGVEDHLHGVCRSPAAAHAKGQLTLYPPMKDCGFDNRLHKGIHEMEMCKPASAV